MEEEFKNRKNQLNDMEQVINDVREKAQELQKTNQELLNKKNELEKKLEVKSGSLEFILDEKETLFNNYQKLIELNKTLKENSKSKSLTNNKKQEKKGWLSSSWITGVSKYFKKKEYENIDVSKGKIRKNIKSNGEPLNIDDQLKNSSNFFASQSDEDFQELKRKRQMLKKSHKEDNDTTKQTPETVEEYIKDDKDSDSKILI
jgi:uncharacterized protein YoxC